MIWQTGRNDQKPCGLYYRKPSRPENQYHACRGANKLRTSISSGIIFKVIHWATWTGIRPGTNVSGWNVYYQEPTLSELDQLKYHTAKICALITCRDQWVFKRWHQYKSWPDWLCTAVSECNHTRSGSFDRRRYQAIAASRPCCNL